MLLKPYANTTIDLANTPMIAFYEHEAERGTGRKMSVLKFGPGTNGTLFYEEDIEALKENIAKYNATGRGNYFWLFANVCINLDLVGSVCVYKDNTIRVTYPGAEWNSPPQDTAHDIYKRYLVAADLRQEKLAAQFAPAAVKPEAAVVPPQPQPPIVLQTTADLEKINKRYSNGGF